MTALEDAENISNVEQKIKYYRKKMKRRVGLCFLLPFVWVLFLPVGMAVASRWKSVLFLLALALIMILTFLVEIVASIQFFYYMWMIPVSIVATIFTVLFYMKFREKYPYSSETKGVG